MSPATKLKIAFIENYIKSGMKVIDAGACVGFFTKYFIEKAGIGNVIAFEPDPKFFKVLDEVTQDGAILEQKALSNFCGKAKFNSSNLIGHSHLSKDGSGNSEVEVTTIDTYCKENEIDILHVLKMDVEGQDLNLLYGAKEIIDKSPIVIIAEFHIDSTRKHFNISKEKLNEFFDNRFDFFEVRYGVKKVSKITKSTDEVILIKKDIDYKDLMDKIKILYFTAGGL